MSKKKRPEGAKVFIIIISIIIVLALFIAIAVFSVLYKKCEIEIDVFVESLVSAFSVFATLILGVVAYWQTRNSNKISKILSERSMICSMIILQNSEFFCSDLNINQIIKFAKKNNTEGVFCTTFSPEKISDHNKNEKYLCMHVHFKIEGASLENLYVENVFINKSFENDDQYLKYFIKFNVLNEKKKVIFSYNPIDQSYILRIYLNIDSEKFNEKFITVVNNQHLFVLDLELITESIYKKNEKVNLSFNLEQIVNLGRILDNMNVKIHKKLNNLSIYKGDF